MGVSRPSSPDLLEDSFCGDAVEVLVKSTPDYIRLTIFILFEEVETSRQYAIEIENRLIENYPPYELTLVHLAAMMITPWTTLRPVVTRHTGNHGRI
ncbi:hypothetical protein FPOAC2_12920 [Fusarium poae]|jgi:hypothetical protein